MRRKAPSVMDTCLGREMPTFASNDHRIAGGAFVKGLLGLVAIAEHAIGLR